MFTQARPPVREARLVRQAPARAFTLIELLTVISIIAILSAISLNVVKGVKERAAASQAKAELASLSQALEMYKLQYGDYPRAAGANVATTTTPNTTDGPGILFNSLAGKLGPSAWDAVNSVFKSPAPINGKVFVDLARLTLQVPDSLPSTTTTTSVANAFVDPWGNRYLYYYKTGATSGVWTAPTYVLLSVGPDEPPSGVDTAPSVTTAGVVTPNSTYGDNDIYANK